MNPDKFGIIDDIKFPKILAVCHKGTQTKPPNSEDTPNSSIHSSKSTGTSPGKNSSNEGSVKIFEFGQIVQDSEHPESITIVKDTFSEEIRDHSSSSTTHDPTSNRYKYCREVIKPFLKDYPSDCQPSDEEIVKDALESVQEDFPDYQPCFGNDGGGNIDKLAGSKKSKDDKQPSLCCEKVKSQTPAISNVGTAFIPVAQCKSPNDKDKGKEKDKSGSISTCNSKDGSIDTCNMDKKDKKKVEDDYDYPYDPCTKPKCPKNPNDICPDAIKPCKKPKSEPKTPPAAFCADDYGPECTRKMTTGCESAEDLKEMAKKSKGACKENTSGSKLDFFPPPIKRPEQRSIMDAHCEALNTLKTAASAVLCKVCDVTKDTVTLIKTESARHMDKLCASRSECEDTCKDGAVPQKPNKKDPCATEVTNILGKKNILENLEQLRKNIDPENNLHEMAEKMDSTISMISDKVDIDAVTRILKSEDKKTSGRRSSITVNSMPREDQRPLAESQDRDLTIAANNMFTAIKSKICSIFSDVTRGTENVENTDEDED